MQAVFDPSSAKTDWQLTKNAVIFYELEYSQGVKMVSMILDNFLPKYMELQQNGNDAGGMRRYENLYAKTLDCIQISQLSTAGLEQYFSWFRDLYDKHAHRTHRGMFARFDDVSHEDGMRHLHAVLDTCGDMGVLSQIFTRLVGMLPPTLGGLSQKCVTDPAFLTNLNSGKQCLDPVHTERRKKLITMIDAIGEYAMKQRGVATWNERGTMYAPDVE
jgi:hypothetical protein